MSQKNKNSLVWRMEKDGLPNVSYLLGTMHVAGESAFAHRELMYEKIVASELFAAELDLDQSMDMVNENAMDLPEGVTLQTLLKPKQYKKADRVFYKATGLALGDFSSSKPFLITSLLTQSALSEGGRTSLDEDLWRFAKQVDKTCTGIESHTEQLAVLAKIPLRYQVRNMLNAFRNIKRFHKATRKTARLFEKADIDGLYKTGKKGLKELKKTMLYNRNRLMAERIDAMAAAHDCCFAVGAGHLAGKRGLLQLLAKKGYRLTPVFKDIPGSS
jgi:uncharacterized protein YbaP (TraB family)